MKYFIKLFICLIFTGLLFTDARSAQNPTPVPGYAVSDDEVNSIASQLYCPVCENTPLDVCPTQACAEWRELIREKLAQGWSERQIKNFFVERFGDRVLAAPPPRGLNWLVYLVPPLFIMIGVFILFRAVKTWRNSTPLNQTEPTPESTGDPYVDLLEEELRKL